MGTLTKKQKERIQLSIELMQKVQPMKIDDLLPYQRNQKDHPEEQIRNLANSLRRFGWRQPVVIDENNVIVIGHGRVLAAKELGMETAPVISAGVRAANMHWKATNASSGMVLPSKTFRPTPARPSLSRLPIKPLTSGPKAMV